MPTTPRRPCVEPRCAAFAMGRYARCELHQRLAWRRDNQADRVLRHNTDLHRALRLQVLAEEERCRNLFCREPYAPGTLDYVQPLRHGGEQVRSNAQRLCAACNGAKGSKSWSEFMDWVRERARLGDRRYQGAGG
jgi:5-methylcytosine-specific restriction endonuclease McrA